jgi:DNA-binding response OmpR family regulator
MEQQQVLLVEDDRSLAHLIARGLENAGLGVTTTDSSVDAILQLQRGRYSVILLDIILSGSSGVYVVDALRDLRPDERPKVVVITGARGNILSTLDRTIVKAVLFKPLDVPSLTAYVKSLV